MANEKITAQEAADILGISRRAVNGLINRGTIQAEKFGAQWAVSKASVLAYKAKKEAEATEKA